MKPESARALAWTAGILILLGLVIMSPTGAFTLFLLAAIGAAFPAVFGHKRPRITAIILCLCALALAAAYYPAFQQEHEAYSQRVKGPAAKTPSPPIQEIGK
ncbi:MAG: hypothetical protein ACM3SV_07810 [Betaproteobacteria bacterium]